MRTDIHRPAEMKPGDYQFLAMSFPVPSYDEFTGRDVTGIEWDSTPEWEALGCPTQGLKSHHCDHCGHALKYVAVLLHTPTGEVITVGHTCYTDRFNVAGWSNRIATAQARVAGNRREADVKAQMKTPEAFDWAKGQRPGSIYADIAQKARQYGSLSEKQIAVLEKGYERASAPKPEEVLIDCPEGRITITGSICKADWYDNMYGSTYKMTVKDDRGFLVFGTVPASIGDVSRDMRVTFTASVERSKDNPSFGFYKRPIGASILVTE